MHPFWFGRYQLLERIGTGGMAEVFRARVEGAAGFERIVALKRLHPKLNADPAFVQMFVDEAKIAVQLSHAGIAQVFDLGATGGRYYIALEHVHGRDLRTIFRAATARGGGVPIAHAVAITQRILGALDYAHGFADGRGRPLGIVHQDVSLHNVMVGFDGQVKLIDFGIARVEGQVAPRESGKIRGKFAYMSPEQLCGQPVDHRSDLFSAGIVLFELVTGSRLFTGSSTREIVRRVRQADVPNPRIINPFVPRRLEEIVMKALSAHPADRFASAAEMAAALDQVAAGAGFVSGRRPLADWLEQLFPGQRSAETARLAALSELAAAPPADSGDSVDITFDHEAAVADSQVTTIPIPRLDPDVVRNAH